MNGEYLKTNRKTNAADDEYEPIGGVSERKMDEYVVQGAQGAGSAGEQGLMGNGVQEVKMASAAWGRSAELGRRKLRGYGWGEVYVLTGVNPKWWVSRKILFMCAQM